MPLKLLPLPQPELATYLGICSTAFVPGVMELMYPHGVSEAAVEHMYAAQKRDADRHPGRTKFLKVVDTDLPDHDRFGGVVGVSQWKILPRERTQEEMEEESEQSKKDRTEFGSSPGLDAVAAAAFRDVIAEYRNKHIGRSAHVLLHAIATRPEHERRGVAALALAWGTQKADEMHLPLFLEGSDKGVPLYKRFGFEVVEVMPFDAREIGYSQPLTHTYMRRPAKG